MAVKKSRRKAKTAKSSNESQGGSELPARLPPSSRPIESLPDPLTKRQRKEILGLLPLSDPESADSAIEVIELHRCFFQGIVARQQNSDIRGS